MKTRRSTLSADGGSLAESLSMDESTTYSLAAAFVQIHPLVTDCSCSSSFIAMRGTLEMR
ncbi:MAG: hypothetical protein ACYYK0_02045 [Candidatus Eutrophobiaceae bacterium]